MHDCWWGYVGLALFAVAAPSCAMNLADFESFPCADNGKCPENYSCLATIGCVHHDRAAMYLPFPCNNDGSCPNDIRPSEAGGDLDLMCIASIGCVPKSTASDYAPFPCPPLIAGKSDNSCDQAGLVCVEPLGCLVPDECDPVADNCSDPKRPKCAVVVLATRRSRWLASSSSIMSSSLSALA